MSPAEFARFTMGAHQREKFEMRQAAFIVEMLDAMRPRKSGRPKSAKRHFPWAFAPDWPDEEE